MGANNAIFGKIDGCEQRYFWERVGDRTLKVVIVSPDLVIYVTWFVQFLLTESKIKIDNRDTHVRKRRAKLF